MGRRFRIPFDGTRHPWRRVRLGQRTRASSARWAGLGCALVLLGACDLSDDDLPSGDYAGQLSGGCNTDFAAGGGGQETLSFTGNVVAVRGEAGARQLVVRDCTLPFRQEDTWVHIDEASCPSPIDGYVGDVRYSGMLQIQGDQLTGLLTVAGSDGRAGEGGQPASLSCSLDLAVTIP